VSLFLVAYPGGDGKAVLTLEFSREGTVVGRSSVELPDADPAGRVPYVAKVPTQSFAPGRYEVSAVVQRDGASARERAFFTIAGEPPGEGP